MDNVLKMAMMTAAAGGHSLLVVWDDSDLAVGVGSSREFYGYPGILTLAKQLPGAMAELRHDQAYMRGIVDGLNMSDTRATASTMKVLSSKKRNVARPFRAPHHSISVAGLCGSFKSAGRYHLGEFALSMDGVLYFDEVNLLNDACQQMVMMLLEDKPGLVDSLGVVALFPRVVVAGISRSAYDDAMRHRGLTLAALVFAFDMIVECPESMRLAGRSSELSDDDRSLVAHLVQEHEDRPYVPGVGSPKFQQSHYMPQSEGASAKLNELAMGMPVFERGRFLGIVTGLSSTVARLRRHSEVLADDIESAFRLSFVEEVL
jgi:hypothetical protein